MESENKAHVTSGCPENAKRETTVPDCSLARPHRRDGEGGAMSPAQHGLLQGVRGDLSPRLDIDSQGVVRARDRTRSTQGPFARTMTSTLFSCPQHAQATPGSRHVSRAEASERTVSRRGSCPHWRRAERLSVLVRARRAVYTLMSVKLKRLPARIWSWKSKASVVVYRA